VKRWWRLPVGKSAIGKEKALRVVKEPYIEPYRASLKSPIEPPTLKSPI